MKPALVVFAALLWYSVAYVLLLCYGADHLEPGR